MQDPVGLFLGEPFTQPWPRDQQHVVGEFHRAGLPAGLGTGGDHQSRDGEHLDHLPGQTGPGGRAEAGHVPERDAPPGGLPVGTGDDQREDEPFGRLPPPRVE